MIAASREAVYEHLAGASLDVAVFRWIPDDMTEVPCIVVLGPDGTAWPAPGASTLPVITIGRNTNDESQQELDALADEVNLLLFKGVPNLQGRLLSWAKGLQAIGGSEFPSYVHTVEVFGNYC